MESNEKVIQYLEEYIPELAEAAIEQAYWQALAVGKNVMISDIGVVKEIFPDGTSKIIERNKPFVKVKKGQIIKLK